MVVLLRLWLCCCGCVAVVWLCCRGCVVLLCCVGVVVLLWCSCVAVMGLLFLFCQEWSLTNNMKLKVTPSTEQTLFQPTDNATRTDERGQEVIMGSLTCECPLKNVTFAC